MPGCARTLTITQHDYVNTQMHIGRTNTNDRTGEPLEVSIVCVYPSDLSKPVNAALSPDSNITSDLWYKMRPRTGQVGGGSTFDLPAGQIYILSDSKTSYGKVLRPRLNGAVHDGKKKIKLTGLDFHEAGKFKMAGSLFNARACLYVFPKFMGTDGQVLKVPPARFHPPGDYRRDLFVEIGVEDRGGREIQFIKNTTDRKLGEDE